ncbi:DUF6186 family protein [Ornithinimicrobium avium]|uniref:Uncharacterized protein n=1 Tax=Ornithinimicrobium avium TaxID=2283195 RepID=A0A345NR95_9MICO|nr:DUF6186 family protein [Ornithinimicrobium avium]AXH97553.1 hypothetical protein DV701_16825 [Ornithinimicrobium avium]
MRLVTVAAYSAVALLVAALLVLPRVRPDLLERPSVLADRMMGEPAARVVLVVFWWWLGWHFLAGATLA